MSSRLNPRALLVGLYLVGAATINSAAAQLEPTLTTADLFQAYRATLEEKPLSISEWEKLQPEMRKRGFTTTDRFSWRLSDSTGHLLITARFGDYTHFDIHYAPLRIMPSGDATFVAALISKAASIRILSGDQIRIRLSTYIVKHDFRPGDVSEYLTFNLRGGVWQESGVSIRWEAR